MNRIRAFFIVATLAAATNLDACGDSASERTSDADGGRSPQDAVTRFLSAAEAQDKDVLGAVWGGVRGPSYRYMERAVREEREALLIRCLRHDSVAVLRSARLSSEERDVSALVLRGRDTTTAHFTVVRGTSGRWFVGNLTPGSLQRLCGSQR
jgi:hypothetical protein